MLSDKTITTMAEEITGIAGVVGVVLGGSRARGTHRPDSDIDLGIFVRGDVDEQGLDRLASQWAGDDVRFGRPGEWGPWVDGGAWLTVQGMAVDWIRRDLDRVDALWDQALTGRHEFHPQPGHPLGFLDVAYCGELATSRILADPTGALLLRKQKMRNMPRALADALIGRIWEADFTLHAAAKAAPRGDTAYVALSVGRAMLLAAHAIHGRSSTWATNEKGLIAAADGLPFAPRGFAQSVQEVLTWGDATPASLIECVESAATLLAQVRAATETR